MIISPEITSCGAARGIRNERLDDRIHRTPAGQNHHRLLVMMLRHPVHAAARLVRVAVGVGVAVLVADARQLGAPGAGHVAPAVAVHLLTLVRLIRCNDLHIFIFNFLLQALEQSFPPKVERQKPQKVIKSTKE